jgi:hypothetical protein
MGGIYDLKVRNRIRARTLDSCTKVFLSPNTLQVHGARITRLEGSSNAKSFGCRLEPVADINTGYCHVRA